MSAPRLYAHPDGAGVAFSIMPPGERAAWRALPCVDAAITGRAFTGAHPRIVRGVCSECGALTGRWRRLVWALDAPLFRVRVRAHKFAWYVRARRSLARVWRMRAWRFVARVRGAR